MFRRTNCVMTVSRSHVYITSQVIVECNLTLPRDWFTLLSLKFVPDRISLVPYISRMNIESNDLVGTVT